MPDPTFQIPKDIINPIIQASVNEAVIRAMDGPNQLVTKAIAGILQMSVDGDGKPTGYNGRPWIDWVIGDCVKKAARLAIEEFMTTQKDRIKLELTAQLAKKNSPLVRQLVEQMAGVIGSEQNLKWNLNVTCAER